MSDEDRSQNGTKQNCTFKSMFKKRRGGLGGGMARKRKESSSSSSSDDTMIVRTEKKTLSNKMIQRTGGGGGVRKRVKVDDSDSDDDDDHGKVKSVVGPTGGSSAVAFSSTGTEVERTDQGATAIRQLDTEMERDARAIHERAAEVHKETKGKEDDKIYRGMNNYAQYIEKRESLIGVRKSIKGPIRAPTNIRSTVRWDYDPCICKDYKETGFCGFGDSCKFMHDRGDYKLGWQLEREVDTGNYGESDDDKYVISDDDDDLPYKCTICHNPFKTPIVTKCKHYFCEKCALEHYKKSQRCYSCGKQTMGTFNPANDLVARMKKREMENRQAPDSSDEETLPNESKPAIPEDDPNYYSVVHEPGADEWNSY